MLVEVPFAGRVWALPVLTAPTPSGTWSGRNGRRHRPVTDWARRLLLALRRWLPGRTIVAVMDGEFAALEPPHALRPRMAVITRLRRDARLFDPPGAWDRRGRPGWRSAGWTEYTSGTALWHQPGKPMVPILWVLVRHPDGRREPEAFLCTDTDASPGDVLELFSRRWAMETTYEEVRAHLGVETQRQWSDPAVLRTTPLLLGLCSVVALHVHQNAERLALPPRRAAWCAKPAATFADAPARLRRHLWSGHLVTSVGESDVVEPIPPEPRRLVEVACYTP